MWPTGGRIASEIALFTKEEEVPAWKPQKYLQVNQKEILMEEHKEEK